MIQKSTKNRAKNGPKMDSNIFSHWRWKNICILLLGSSWKVLDRSWNPEFPMLARLGALLDRFHFFLPLLGRLLGPSGVRQGPPGRLPGAFWRPFFHIKPFYQHKNSILAKMQKCYSYAGKTYNSENQSPPISHPLALFLHHMHSCS